MKGFLFEFYGREYFIPSNKREFTNRYVEKILKKIASKEECTAQNIMDLQESHIKCEIKDGIYNGTHNGKPVYGAIVKDREDFIQLEEIK